MAYTNIASPYWTGNWGPANYNFNKHSWTLFNQDNPNFSKAQFKVAMQQLQQQGVLDSTRGWANEKLKADVLRGTPGIGSDQNPLGQFQGQYGNFGRTSYDLAKAAGWKPQDIYDEIASGRSGMQMMGGAKDLYYKDIKARDDAMWAERIADIPTAAELMAEMPQPKIRAGQDYATTGRSAQGMRIKKGTKFAEGGKRGTKGYFGRGAKFTGNSTPAMNIKGGGGGSASQASNTLNTV